MTAAVASGCCHDRGEDWVDAAWRTWAALVQHAPCLPVALGGYPERHIKQFEHSKSMHCKMQLTLLQWHQVLQAVL